MPFPADMLTPAPTPPAAGFTVRGPNPGSQLSRGGAAGDLNGDGLTDYWFSARTGADDRVYVVYGTASGFLAPIDLLGLNGANGFQIIGPSGDNFGTWVAGVGDVNGDGIDDLALANGYGPGNVENGSSFVLFGRQGGFDATLDAATFGPDDGFIIHGGPSSSVRVQIVASDDLNGDGLNDILLAQRSGTDTIISVVYGRDGSDADLSLAALDPAEGFSLVVAGGSFGRGRAMDTGDFNGDGLLDLVIGAPLPGEGEVHVLFGKAGGFGSPDLAAIPAEDGFTFRGMALFDAGETVIFAGDINGDGFDDIAIGGLRSDNTGVTYVLFGTDTGIPAGLTTEDLDGTNGFRVSGGGDGNFWFGLMLAGPGDVNGDGFDDLVIGDENSSAHLTYGGAAFVVFGKASGFGAVVDVTALDGTNGLRIDARGVAYRLGAFVGEIGDVNGDGLADMLVGAPAGASNLGSASVIYGQASLLNLTGAGTDDVLNGNLANDVLTGLGGQDILNGGGADDALDGGDGADQLFGGAGIDDLVGGAGGDLLDGGTGADQMAGGLGDDTYVVDDLSDVVTELGGQGADRVRAAISYTLLAEVEQLELTGSGDIDGVGNGLANRLDGNGGDNRLSGLAGADAILGMAGDDTIDGGDNGDTLYGGDGGDDLLGGAGGDVLYGDDGDDDLDGGADGDKLFGGAGADDLIGGLGNDRLDGGDGVDVLTGGAGADALDGGAGADSLIGGLDNDIYILGAGDTATEGVGEGYDIVRTDLDGWVLGANFEALELQGGTDIAGFGNGEANRMDGNGGDNLLDGAAGVDTINGGDGDDIIVGGLGNDLLRGGIGADTFKVAHAFGPVLETDQVYDFSAAEGDILDLADAYSGTLSVVSRFSKQAGEMTLTFASGITTVRLDVTGDGKVDYQMKLNGDLTGESGGWLL